jgi:nicotinamide riboside kinase
MAAYNWPATPSTRRSFVRVIGLTGGIASGKSTVSRILKNVGAVSFPVQRSRVQRFRVRRSESKGQSMELEINKWLLYSVICLRLSNL